MFCFYNLISIDVSFIGIFDSSRFLKFIASITRARRPSAVVIVQVTRGFVSKGETISLKINDGTIGTVVGLVALKIVQAI